MSHTTGNWPGQLMLRTSRARPRSQLTQTKIIQSRFLHIYGLLCLGSLMGCIRTICASIVQQTVAEADGADKEREAEPETGPGEGAGGAGSSEVAEAERRAETEADAEADARIMATGICIIRLITLKRFLEISTTDEHNQRRQQSATSAGVTSPRSRRRQPHSHPGHPGHTGSHHAAGHPEACWRHQLTPSTLLMLLLLTSLWPDCCDCLHGGSNTVKTKYGLLRGIVVRSSPLVEAFLGIPYASPPVGSLR